MIETMTAFLILIPVGLAAFNLFVLVSTTQINEQLAETASRAAATKGDQQGALNAAQDAVDHVATSNVIQSAALEQVNFDPVAGFVNVTTTMVVKLPVPLPYFSEANCRANSIQPIVSTPAPR